MKIYYPENFFTILKEKHLLLDTNVLIDSFNVDSQTTYISFFNKLKDNDTALVTIESVIFEFLKGSKNNEVYNTKKEHIDDIVDAVLPGHKDDNENINKLILLSGSDGGGVQIADYYLGANLLKYRKNLYLMTRNVKDFPQNIFSLASTVSFSSFKTIFTYGIYTYAHDYERRETPVSPDDIPF